MMTSSGIDRYDYAFDPDGTDWPARLLRQVPATGTVLELGPGAGAMTKALLARGHAMTVIENDPESVALLQQLDCQVVVADLDGQAWPERLGRQKFDAILACDVLEHLKQPEQVLQTLRRFANPACTLVISMPNIAYAGVVAGLCQGLFEYADKGVLDRTHLKFFTRRSFERLLHEQGWAPMHWEGNELPVERSEFVWQWQALPAAQRQFLAAAPYSDVYQWMAVSTPVADVVVAEVRHARSEARAARAQLHELTLRHEAEHASLLDHQKAFAEARETIRQLQLERDGLKQERDGLKQERDGLKQERDGLKQRQQEIMEQVAVQKEQASQSAVERKVRALWRRLRGERDT